MQSCDKELASVKDIHRYSYNIRTQFYHDGKQKNNYRVLVREDTLEVICFSVSCKLESYSKSISKGESYIAKLELLEAYNQFNSYKELLTKCNVTSFWNGRNGKFLQIYLGAEYYMLYDPNSVAKSIISKDSLIKKYEKNWYLYKTEKPLDFG